MSTAEIKKKLIDRIESTNDPEILLEATRLLDIQLEHNEEPFELSPKMVSEIELSQQQFDNGECLSHKEANQEIDKWFEK